MAEAEILNRSVEIGARMLPGDLAIPPAAGAIIVFAHGSGSSRLSPRNRRVAAVLNRRGFATLLFDLLSESEAGDRQAVFDIALLSQRLIGAIEFAQTDPQTAGLTVGLFGASTGAAAALMASSERDEAVGAVVSRGGRPDLAGDALAHVRAPTLLIVGGADEGVLQLNRQAAQAMGDGHELEIVLGAGHLFEAPGAMDTVTALAGDWFARHLSDESR